MFINREKQINQYTIFKFVFLIYSSMQLKKYCFIYCMLYLEFYCLMFISMFLFPVLRILLRTYDHMLKYANNAKILCMSNENERKTRPITVL